MARSALPGNMTVVTANYRDGNKLPRTGNAQHNIVQSQMSHISHPRPQVFSLWSAPCQREGGRTGTNLGEFKLVYNCEFLHMRSTVSATKLTILDLCSQATVPTLSVTSGKRQGVNRKGSGDRESILKTCTDS